MRRAFEQGLGAAGLVALAYANDGGGSIRIPAAACGVFGFKPSRGRTVATGFAESEFLRLTSDGCISHSVRDSALFVSLLEDPSSGLPELGFVRAPLDRSLRIATWTNPQTLSSASRVSRAVALARCRSAG